MNGVFVVCVDVFEWYLFFCSVCVCNFVVYGVFMFMGLRCVCGVFGLCDMFI